MSTDEVTAKREERLHNGASESARAAERYAAELIDKSGPLADYDKAVTWIAVAYLEGQCVQLKWALDKVRGDG